MLRDRILLKLACQDGNTSHRLRQDANSITVEFDIQNLSASENQLMNVLRK